MDGRTIMKLNLDVGQIDRLRIVVHGQVPGAMLKKAVGHGRRRTIALSLPADSRYRQSSNQLNSPARVLSTSPTTVLPVGKGPESQESRSEERIKNKKGSTLPVRVTLTA